MITHDITRLIVLLDFLYHSAILAYTIPNDLYNSKHYISKLYISKLYISKLYISKLYISKHPPPINSRSREFVGTVLESIPRK